MNLPDLIFLLQTGSPRTFAGRVTRPAEKQSRSGEHCKKCIRIQSRQEKKIADSFRNLYLDI